MRADAHAALQRQPRGALHGGFIAGVSAAGDVGGGDVLHERGFVRGVFQFAHVAIEIDLVIVEYSHCSCSLQQLERLFDGDPLEPHFIARPQLAQAPEIGRDHVGRLGISAGGLVLHEENDGLPVGRHLDRRPAATPSVSMCPAGLGNGRPRSRKPMRLDSSANQCRCRRRDRRETSRLAARR